MGIPDQHAPVSHADASRPSLGFPLGTALLLIVIFSLSGIFSCCYHWDKLRSLRQSHSDDTAAAADLESGGQAKPSQLGLKEEQSLSVAAIMAGDEIPKFVAVPCPYEPPRRKNLVTPPVEKPLKPPHFPVPLY
ncbi:hypothetical protein Nepgr_026494 [Nepenthes gracilis]|uniref:Hydroxyproline-rich glycoprotein family protein n=1 Tax=Nepenthes gracilis TaxID=150966 RepID=A0AAD3T9V2_NEPGR|nr:hypothetical protein Nepgr_026494 [Nepenthes gracilis]